MNIRMALRYLSERKLRTALTTLAIVLGVALIFGLNSVLPTMQAAFRENLMAQAEMTDLTVTSTTRGPFDASVVPTVAQTEGVSTATGMLVRPVVLPTDQVLTSSDGRTINTVMLMGVDPATYFRVQPLGTTSGRLLQPADSGAPVALIGKAFAQNTGLGVGDSLTLPAATGQLTLEIVGLLDIPSAPGVDEVFVPLETAQGMVNLPGLINTLEAMFAPGADSETVRQAVLDRLGPGYKVGTVEAGSEFAQAMQVGQYAFLFFGIMALAMGAFIIFITFRTSVVERRRDIGMLRSIGASRQTVLGLVLTESLIQGVLGTGIGIGLGYLMTWGLTTALAPLFESLMRFQMPSASPTLGTFSLAVALGLGFTVIGAVAPAVSAGRVTPLEAMAPPRPEGETELNRKRALGSLALGILSVLGLVSGNLALAALGAVLFVAALLMAGPVLVAPISRVFGRLLGAIFAREGRVAESNLARQPGRAAVTVSVIMIGLAILVAMGGLMTTMMGGMTGYIDKSLGSSDYIFMPQSLILGGGNVGAGPEFIDRIRSTPGVSEATGLRLATTAVEGLHSPMSKFGGGGTSEPVDIQLVGIDPDLYPDLAGLTFRGHSDAEAYPALKSGRSIIVNDIFASTNGVKTGQDLSILTPSGPQTYHVVGIGSDFINFKLATGYVSQAVLAQDFGETSDVLVFAGRDPGADSSTVTDALWSVARDYPAFTLFETTQWRADMMDQISTIMLLFPVLMVLLATPSLIALVNTLGINVIERTREIGVLRAVGATRRQIRRIIMAESLLLAAIGTAFGLLSGVWLGYIIVKAMQAAAFDFPYVFPWAGIIITMAVGLIFGVVAALVPARQAARLNVVRALQYE